MRKVEGGLRQLAAWVDEKPVGSRFLIDNRLTLADIAAGSFLGWFALRWADHPSHGKYPQLKQYRDGLEELESFKSTRPSPQTMKDKIV